MVAVNPNLTCTLVTPEAKIADEKAFDVVLPAHDGLLGILSGHAPLLCKLGQGLLRYHDELMGEKVYYIEGGFAHVHENKVLILARRVVARGELSTAEAEHQLRQAEAMAQSTAKERELRSQAIQRAKHLIALSQLPSGGKTHI
ncbi:MAG: ATP synthase epsilon chain [Planctomycetes bacterium ADurb.Bin412]|nr:MAG: ATP synthase epsilon chain [Planctomycetes bacterium ADurb.Bin412]